MLFIPFTETVFSVENKLKSIMNLSDNINASFVKITPKNIYPQTFAFKNTNSNKRSVSLVDRSIRRSEPLPNPV